MTRPTKLVSDAARGIALTEQPVGEAARQRSCAQRHQARIAVVSAYLAGRLDLSGAREIADALDLRTQESAE